MVGPWALQVYSSDPEVIAYGLERMLLVCTPYALCGVMNVLVGAMRGLGSSLTPMVVSIFGVCVLRVVWIYTVFPLDPSFAMLFPLLPGDLGGDSRHRSGVLLCYPEKGDCPRRRYGCGRGLTMTV